MRITKVIFLTSALSGLGIVSASADAKFRCSEVYLLSFSVRDGESHALLGTELKSPSNVRDVKFFCGFGEGHKFKLSKLSGWTKDRSENDTGVWIYRGLSNSCSEGQILIFNAETNLLLMVKASDLSSQVHKCTETTE